MHLPRRAQGPGNAAASILAWNSVNPVEWSWDAFPNSHLTVRVTLVANPCTIRDDIWLLLSHRTHKDLLAKWRSSRSASQRRKRQR